jgi:putative FmdB family regulatory protein
MPLYEYVCQSCRHGFERYVQSFGDAVSCPACQGVEVEKQLSTFAFAFAGGSAGAAASSGGCRATGGGCGCGAGGCGCAH